MSRTYKDKPQKYKDPSACDYTWGHEKVPYDHTYHNFRTGEELTVTSYWLRDLPGVKPKRRKELDTEWHWMTTPSWWTRMMMNRPQRRSCHLWEHQAARMDLESLEDLDTPPSGKKPHKYYW